MDRTRRDRRDGEYGRCRDGDRPRGTGRHRLDVVVRIHRMATKYAEAILAVKYRVVDERGEIAGGPMYY